jgi:diguanylate cyclase (GGDEF)-like protein/PAS domain S-box-containing protein
MRSFLRYIALLLLVLAPCLEGEAARYVKLTQLTTENGLRQNTITGLIQDSDGYLWIATSEGLGRFDAYRMKDVESPQDHLSGVNVDFVWQDSTGLIWISSDPKNNYQFDSKANSLERISFPTYKGQALNYPVIQRIEENKQNNLWIATYEDIIFYDREADQYEVVFSIKELFHEEPLEHLIRDILLIDDYLFVATSGGLYLLDLSTKESHLVSHTKNSVLNADQNNVKELLLDSNSQLMIGTVEGLFTVDLQQLLLSLSAPSVEIEISQVVENLNIWQVIEKSDFYWLATDKGLYELSFDGNLELIVRFSETPFSTSDDDIVTMFEDREGNLWLGTRSDGVFKWRPQSAIKRHWWGQAAEKYQLSSDMVNGVAEDQNNTLWVATLNGLTSIDQQDWSTKHYLNTNDEKQLHGAASIYSIAERNGRLWLLTGEGLEVFNIGTLEKEPIVFPEDKKEIFTRYASEIFFISDNELLLMTEFGVYEYSIPDNKLTLIESTQIKGNDTEAIYGFYQQTNKSGNLLAAGEGRIWSYSKDTQQKKLFHRVSNSDIPSVNSDVELDEKYLWATYPGIGIYQLDRVTGEEIHFISEEEIGANSLMDIFSDNVGNLWITSNDGLIRLDRDSYQVTKFDRNDGFATSEFNGQTNYMLSDGSALIGSIKGLFQFDPSSLDEVTEFDVATHITGLSLLSSNARLSDKLNNSKVDLEYDDFGLKFSFSALLFDKPNQVRYYYWMEGDSKISKTLLNESELFFPKIEQGSSHLYISAVDYRTGKETVPVSIEIISHPPPWKTVRALIIYILSSAVLFLLLLRRYRIRQQFKAQALKKIQQSEERLVLALKGGNSGLWDWDATTDMIYEPRLAHMTQCEESNEISFKERTATIHYKDQNNFTALWRSFLNGESKVFDASYRLKNRAGEWQWYRDVAMVSRFDDNEKPRRVTGTFTNITEKQEATEKSRLYSKAFENTLDIIVILDNQQKISAANRALEKITGRNLDSIIGKTVDSIVKTKGDRESVEDIIEKILEDRNWKGEASLIKDNGEEITVLVNATIFLENDTELYYVLSMSDISKQKQAEINLKKLVNFDALTGLPNRTLLLDRITHAIPHCRRYKKRLAVFFVDLDRFKQINDTLGHDIGDLLLVKTAEILTDSCRENDTISRIGGDEFVLMLEDVDSVTAINRIVQNILLRMKVPAQLKESQVTISASIGISIFPQDANDADTLLKHADIAMYHAKNKGRNNFQYFEEHMNRAVNMRLEIENKVRSAVDNKDFFLVYQPQYNFETGELRGVEALARWRSKDGQLISPHKFVPVAEDLGLINTITEELLVTALKQLTKWRAEGYDLKLAFNLSAQHIYAKHFMPFIEKLTRRFPEVISSLEFELTESSLMTDIEKGKRIFEKLDNFNIELALDDFGTGYSSLKYLSSLPISKLKIARSFVGRINSSFENDTIIEAIISLAKSLSLETVAEGIETGEQFEFLKNANVSYAQGFLLSKPLEVDGLEKILNKNIYSCKESELSHFKPH